MLNPKAAKKKFHHARYLPVEELDFFIEHFWSVQWDLQGQEPYLQELLPHPSIHVVFEKDTSRVVGIVTGKFSRLLKNRGRVFGIKFKPGAFYPFVKTPVSEFTDHVIRVEDIFGDESKALENTILSLEDENKMIELAEDFLRERLPERDETVPTINRIVCEIVSDREIIKLDDVVKRFKLSKRTLQRLFNQYVGVSPKWVIKRYRLHEALEQLAASAAVDWPKLALELGYFDQAHFIKDFKALIGQSPSDYAREIGLI